jgi:hypothetical protein
MKSSRYTDALRIGFWLLLMQLLLATVVPCVAQNDTEFDSYKVRIEGFWFYSNPSGNIQGSTETGNIDLQKDLGFNSYSTFSGKLDWKFTHKNHFYLVGSSFDQTRQHMLTRSVVYQGHTFDVGLSTRAHLSAPMIAPGYQYDILRRKRGHLGLGVQIDLFDASAKLSAAAQVVNGMQHPAVSASGSLLAPIPVAGPEFRLYLTNSPRVFVEGNLYGMYLFGYGNFLSTADDIGFAITKHLSVNAGYQLGSRLIVNNKNNDRIGIHLTQSGAIAGMELSF